MSDPRLDRALDAAFSVPCLQSREELREFGQVLLDRHITRVLEIGSLYGGTLRFFGELCPDLVVSVDWPDGPGGIGIEAAKIRDVALMEDYPQFQAVRGDAQAQETFQTVLGLTLPHGVGCAFIDGDHRRAAVEADYHRYLHLVSPGGLVALHDASPSTQAVTYNIEVPEFWATLPEPKRLIHAPGQDGFGIGLIDV